MRNMMRTYYAGGKRRVISQARGITAVQQNSPCRLVSQQELLRSAAIDPKVVKPFQSTGWSFHPRDQGLHTRDDSSSHPPASSGTVFHRIEDQGVLLGTDRLIVRFVPDLVDSEVYARLERKKLTVLRKLRFAPNLVEVQAPPEADILDLANEIPDEIEVIYAEPVLISEISARQRFVPNDPEYPKQWHLNNSLRKDIRAELAWGKLANQGRGRGIRVAVIDNGFDINHEDLVPNIAAGSGYFVSNGLDAEFAQDITNYPISSHGTFCAGMVGARGHNAIGVCGVAFESDLLLIACLPDQVGSQVTLARAIAYAADPSLEVADTDPSQGADIIVCSLGPYDNNYWQLTSVLADAITFATTQGRSGLGTPVFWAVSNREGAITRDEVVSRDDVIAVGRSNQKDIQGRSAFGAGLDFLAPGVEVYSTRLGNAYGSGTGTSYAAPCAAGVAALMLSAYPQLPRSEIQQMMRETCDKIGKGAKYDQRGFNKNYGFGRINAEKAVAKALELQRGNGGYISRGNGGY